MATLREYMKIKEQVQKMESDLAAIENNESFQNDLKFFNELETLLEVYEKTKEEAAELLNPHQAEHLANNAFIKKPRKPREPKTYKNPETGETVTTAGGNHTVLKKWRSENPDLDVSDWIVTE
ncbi:histone-like nucleoid-structuring protein, MvaT/MvaU family [Marinobacter sp. ELB17]|uniref:histone-like nucleoid-structuring protein, MvaT/MvaU family n=1 Tax=Marinobacter sp. ELB17 TaxID=270374 RepID=UPI0000F3B3DC|nr:histone-like nucleoid-structuring protein, MvaT/MvaU family [Marinobacter sp. ELB17]EAZ98347.1 transcriptional regulator, putative [Marinobacter sp. ELB17]